MPLAPKEYVKKPVRVTAMQIPVSSDKESLAQLLMFLPADKCTASLPGDNTVNVNITTLEGVMRGTTGNYIIRGVKGEFYPCKEEIFNMTYEEA